MRRIVGLLATLACAGASAFGQCVIPVHGVINAPGAMPAGDRFGAAMAADGDRVVIGAPGEGAVYVYQGSGTNLTHAARLAPATALNEFGWSVDIDGDRIVVGTLHGTAVVFDLVGSAWTEAASLVPSGPPNAFSKSIAVSGDRIAVGDGSQAVYLYQRFAGLWFETQKISTSNSDVDLDGDDLVIGRGGVVDVFANGGASWSLVASFPSAGMGYSVSLDGERFAVAGTSTTRIYDRVLGNWGLTQSLGLSADVGVVLRGNRVAGAHDFGSTSRLNTAEFINGAWQVGYSTNLLEPALSAIVLNDEAVIGSYQFAGAAGTAGRVYLGSDEVPFVPYGNGCPGTGGFVPELSFSGCASAGQSVTLAIDQGLAGQTALVFLGFDQVSVPIDDQGCLLLVGTLVPIVFALPLFGSGPGNGSIQVNFGVPTGPFVSLKMQTFVSDPAGKKGFVASNAVIVNIE